MNRLHLSKAELAWSEEDSLDLPAENQMGMGGFYIYSRVGLDTPYIYAEFIDHVKALVRAAKAKGLLACLYDEDTWPSGAAGGLVVADNPEYKAVHLLYTK
ncbi:hypothetical protein DER46DRAFT_665828 [Fusarium sp. MPI-SDFR-AT-0072]|nr:hypothetical protein DER46DRAFT_665828 [Fusarium sp. MPI-SDFR-AT-0072]